MKYEVTATRDFTGTIGDRSFDVKKGDKVSDLSAAGVEIVLSRMANGAFELSGETPETEAEKKRARAAEEKAALAAKKKEVLVKQADRLGVEDAEQMLKADLVEAVAEANTTKKEGKK